MLIHLSDAENIGNRHELRVAVDVHVRRISRYLGLTDPAAKTITDTVRQEIQDAWDRDIRDGGAFCPMWPLVNTAGALDPALWAIGKYGCKATCEKGGEKTRIADFCSTCRFDELFRAGSKDRPGSIGPAGSQKEPRRRRQRALSTLDEEHYKVALSYNGRPFTAKEFKARYRHTYADRPETSILPTDRCIRRSRSTRRMIKSLIRHADGPPRRLDDNGDVELAND